VVNNAALAINHSDALTIANTISGTGSLTHLGTGTTTLTANNTYTGSTTISAGTLQIGNNGTTGTLGTGAVINNAALIFDRSDAVTITYSMSGTGSLTKLRANTLTLTGANTYSGATTVSEGTLRAASTSAFSPNSTVTVVSGAVLDVAGWTNSIGSLAGAGTVTNSNAATTTLTVGNNNASTNFSGVIQNGAGAIALTKTGTGMLTLSGTNTYTGATNVNAGILQILNTSTVSNDGVLGSGAVAVASGAILRFTNSRTANDAYQIANIISGAGSLLFDGPDGSITTLSNANTYSGGTTIASGVVNIGNNTAFGTGTVTMVGGAIRATLAPRTLANAFNLSGTIGLGLSTNITGAITLSGNSTITCSSNCGVTTFSGPIALGANTLSLSDTGPNTLGGVWAGNNLILSGIISGSGGVTQGSSGTLTLSGANTYTGVTNVNAGTLALGASNVLANATALSVASGATFNLAGFTDTIASLNSAVGSIVTLGNGSLTTTGAQNYDGQVTGGNVTLASTGGGAITANNPTNDFTGTLNLSSTGAISVVDANALTLGAVSGSTISARTIGALSNLILGGNLTASAISGDSIILAAGRDVDNSGNRTLTTAGTARWLIYSGDTANATQSNGGLTGFNRYGCTYNAGSPSCAAGTNIPATGNGFYYAFAPTLTITPSALAALTYGDAAPSLVGYTYGVSGYLGGDSALDTRSGSLTGTTTYTPTSNVGSYNINYDSGTLDSALGYVFNYVNNPTAITVNKALLVATANGQTITYGTTVPNSTITYTGFVNGENDSVIDMLATLNSANSGIVNAGTYVGNYTASGALDNNYNFTYVAGNLAVNKASLVATANGQTITYGTTVPNSTITYTGFVNGDTASVIDMLATLNSANSGIVNAGTYVGNYTASGALDNNYNFTYVAGNLLVNNGTPVPPTTNPPPTTNNLPPTVERVVQDAVQVVGASATSSGAGNVSVVVQDKGSDGKDIVVLDDQEIETIQDGDSTNNNALIIVSKQFLQALDDRVARELNHLSPRENRPIAL
jgi:autotransporter-associated beta strand protein